MGEVKDYSREMQYNVINIFSNAVAMTLYVT